MNKIARYGKTLAAALVVVGLAACSSAPVQSPTADVPAAHSELLVYSGSGLKKPMEQIKQKYEATHADLTITYVYAGSAQLLAQIQLSGKGDVLIVGSEDTYKSAQDKGLAGTPTLVAHHTPAIAVAKGNPKKITGLADLARSGVRVAIGDPKSNAIGATTATILANAGLTGIQANVVTQTATLAELFTAITAGNADAAIVTKDGYLGQEATFDLIEIPADQNIDQLIPLGVLTTSKSADQAKAFTDYVSSDQGKAVFEKLGFAPQKG